MQSTKNKEFTKLKYTTHQNELYQRRRKASVHYMPECSLAEKLM